MRSRRALAATLAGLLVLLSVLAATASPSPAQADTAPPDSTLPATVSTDALPTAQIDGVAWTQLVVGNTVFVGGGFTTARPAGAAPNTQTVPRSNLMAYNVQTGELLPFAPVLNGQVRGLAASTDGKTLYVVGAFTTVNGVTRNRIAAFDVATGALSNTFKPNVNYTILGVTTTENTVYFGGSFTTVNGIARLAAAAVDSVSGALRPWAPQKSTSGDVRQLIVSPDRSKVILGGSFLTMNGSSNPGYGLAAVDTNTGANLPLPVNSLIRDANTKSAIMSLVATPDGFYGSGYAFSKTDGNLEGSFKSDWDGNLVWVEDCHGDTYSIFPFNGAIYAAGHPHFCGNIGGFPQTDPVWTYQRGIAFTQAATGLATKDQYGYFNYEGKPRPTLLNWFPDINTGTYTGQSQGPWSISGNSDYVVYGGEFTQVNGQNQQGLVRFGKASVAPNQDAPRLGGSQFLPTIQNFASGVRLSWPANYDRDNELLSYALIRNGNNGAPIYTVDKRSTFWNRPNLSFLDTTVTPGTTYNYRIRVTDPKGNVRTGDPVTVTASGGAGVSDYDKAVLADGPSAYWPMGESSGTTVTDYAGSDNATKGATVTQGVTGAIPSDVGTAYRFPGTVNTSTVGSTALRTGPMIFSAEAWFKTTSTRGGKIIGFGKSASGNSANSDRHIYMSNAGKIYFGVNPGAIKTVNSTASYNNGQWHHVVGTLGTGGMSLYVDGQLVGS
ncbi:MAG: LamG domain-containing protein, partial [Propionibacteriaceae bacterium]